MDNSRDARTQLGSFFSTYVLGPLVSIMRWFLKTSVKIFAWLAILFTLIFLSVNVWIFVNNVRTDFEVIEVNGVYSHSDDQMTTDIINWLTGYGTVPNDLKLPLYRQYVKTIRENAGMEIPENFLALNYQELHVLSLEWYDQKYPNRTDTREERIAIVESLFEESVKPPLEGFGPNVYERVWLVVDDTGAPRVRLIAEQDEYPSRIVATSAPGGDNQAFYYPPENTIYIRYNDSMKVLLDEVPHAEQFDEHPFRSYWRLFGSLGQSFLSGSMQNANLIYRNGYSSPATLEGEAHGALRAEILARQGLSIVYEEVPNMLAPQHACVVPDPLRVLE